MDKTDFSAFGQYIPGFDFLQTLARQASGVKPDLQPVHSAAGFRRERGVAAFLAAVAAVFLAGAFGR